ncbi:uncharacterized protein [Misgurnus anguillicaudatus]|uniref:uncharacterized protein n=1 Tax=Misgurnus anguillicaudatus TaxID=75329 RepID=UPI003CCFB1D2
MTATTRSQRAKLKPNDEAAYYISMSKDKDGFEIKFINSFKGRGVFSCRHFQKGDFLFEYRGRVLTKEEYERRHSELEVFLFEFRFDGRQLWVDASKDDGSLGRLVNDDHVNPNSKMKIITVNRKPHLCLFAVKNISPGDEIMYNYGDSDWPWRNKVTFETEQQSHHSINCAGDNDGTQKVTSETEQQSHRSINCAGDNDGTQKVTSETEQQSHRSINCAGDNDGTQKVTSETEQQSHRSINCAGDNDGTQKVTSETEQQSHRSINCAGDNDGTQKVTSETEQQSHRSINCAGDNDGTQKVTSETEQQSHRSINCAGDNDGTQKVTSETEQQSHRSINCAGDNDGTQKVTSETEQQSHRSINCAGDNDGTQKVTSETEQQSHRSINCAGDNDGTQKVTSETEQQSHRSINCAGDNDGTQKVTSETEQQSHRSINCAGDNDGTQKVTSETEQQSHHSINCAGDNDGTQKKCQHVVVCSVVSSLDKCESCTGPYSAFKWIGVKCQICCRFWHKTCYDKNVMLQSDPITSNSEECSNESDQDYVPDFGSDHSEESTVSEVSKQSTAKIQKGRQCQERLKGRDSLNKDPFSTAQAERLCSKSKHVQVSGTHNESRIGNTGDTSVENITGSVEDQCVQPSNISSSVTKKNYCFICGKPQSKYSRHLKVHEKTNAEVARALALPKHSKERKQLLDKLRNQGNYEHNTDVLTSGTGLLKIRRKPKKKFSSKDYVHCMYCHAMFLRRDLWRHVRNCPSKPVEDGAGPGKNRVLHLASVSDSTLCQQISQGVWKLLTLMKDDMISAAVRSDFCILQLAQSFFNKHGQDPTKFDYIRQKLREVGRLLLVLRREFSIQTLEDAIRPANFKVVVQAVKKVSGFDENKHSYQTPSLALKLGHSLHKISDIIHCKALMADDSEGIKSSQTFKKLYNAKWSELVSHTALNTLHEGHFNKPSTLPFTEDVQRLHQHLEMIASSTSDKLTEMPSAQVYAELCKATLAKIILFNRRRGGEVAKMQLKSFQERDTAPLHKDVAVGLTKFEQKLCAHFSRVEIKGKRGRKVAVLLSPDMVNALTQLISRRKECGVPEENTFLFARPNCLTPYRGQDCLRIYADECGAKNPELLRSTQLRKHVATLSQVLNLKNHELDQVADFLGHDIRVHREYYRLPEATTQLAKISKLLLAMEKGSLTDLQGKTLEEMEIEDHIDFTDSEQSEDSEASETDPQTQTIMDFDSALEGSSEAINQPTSKQDKKHARREKCEQPGLKKARRTVEEPPGTSYDDFDSALEGSSEAINQPTSKKDKKHARREKCEQPGLKKARRTVEEPPGTSYDDFDSALEGSSKAINQPTSKKDKKHARREKCEQPGLKKARRTVEEPPGTSYDDFDSALEGSSEVILENSAESGDARRIQKRVWSPTEISAVMRHFRNHIAKCKLATKIECLQCKNAEHPALDSRSVQNIRDFVRNRGLTLKRKQLQNAE